MAEPVRVHPNQIYNWKKRLLAARRAFSRAATHGVYFTAQSIRLYHPEVTCETEILVVDNHPDGPCAWDLKALENSIDAYRYVPWNRTAGTSVRDIVFREANAEFVLCVDCHVLFVPGALRRLLDYLIANPETPDLLQGPLLYDGPKDGSGEPPDPGRNGEQDFHGERRRNDTHGSTTDPETRLFRKGPGKEARLCFMGHALMENRNGLIVGALTTTASGYAEREAALALIEPHGMTPQPVTLGADKGSRPPITVGRGRSPASILDHAS